MTCHISFEHHSNRICCQITQNAITPSEMPADSRSGKQIPMCAFPRQMLGKFQHGIPPMMTSPEFLARSVGPRPEPIVNSWSYGAKKKKGCNPSCPFLRTFMSSSESYYPFPWESDEQAPYPRKLSPDTAQVLSKLATLQPWKKRHVLPMKS